MKTEAQIIKQTLLDAAEAIDEKRSLRGIAARALDPGRAWSVEYLRDRAERIDESK